MISARNDQHENRPNPALPLPDNQLVSEGLKPIRTYINSGKSKDAKKAEQYKNRMAEMGIRQLNVMVKDEYREFVKELVRLLNSGKGLFRVLVFLIRKHCPEDQKPQKEIDRERRIFEIGKQVCRLNGWRRWLVMLLLGN